MPLIFVRLTRHLGHTAVLALLAASAVGQSVTWTPLSGSGPSARFGTAMAYDAARQELVLFGGVGIGGVRNDTWTRNGTAWSSRTSPSIPPARAWHAMAYDPTQQVVVLFGGNDGAVLLGDTWEWNGTQWTNRTPTSTPQPAPRDIAAMTFDEGLGQVLVYGGRASIVPYVPHADTWAWSSANGTWTDLMPAMSPTPDSGDSMAYDCARQRTVLVQRTTPTLPSFVETWEDDATANTWLQQVPATRPIGRFQFQVAYDRVRERVVLFGGGPWFPQGPALDDTWEWDGVNWTQQLPLVAPPGRRGYAMAWDATRERVVVFGGQDSAVPINIFADAWDYDSLHPATFTSSGTGCGPGGPLTLDPAPCSLPWLGDTFTIDIGNVPAGAALFMVIGLSPTNQSTPWPGCTQLVTCDAVGFLPMPSWSMTLPNVPAFQGLGLYFQAAALDSAGLSTSAAGHAVLGSR